MSLRLVGFTALALALLLAPGNVSAVEESVDTRELERVWQQVQDEYNQYLPQFAWKDLGATVNFRGLVVGLGRYLLHEVRANASLLGQLVILAVLSALLNNLQTSFASEGVAQVCKAAVVMVLLAVGMYSFSLAFGLARRTVQVMGNITAALVPVMLSLMAALGSLAAASVFQPVLLTAAAIVGNVVSNFILPVLMAAAVLAVVDNMVQGIGVKKMAGLLKDLSTWSLGLLLTIFVGVTVINGGVAAVADGVALRAGKFTAKAFIPVVGNMFSDAFETVAGATLVLKNSIGLFGVVAIVISCLFPLIKLFAITLIYRGTAALLQPLGEETVSDTLETMAHYMYAVIAAVAAVGLMFFMIVAIIVAASNLMVMVR